MAVQCSNVQDYIYYGEQYATSEKAAVVRTIICLDNAATIKHQMSNLQDVLFYAIFDNGV